MFLNKKFLAIIPARKGSKGLPHKNRLALLNKPLISWSMEAATKSKYIDKTVVSSDDEEILQLAKKNSIDTILRPSELATDTATSYDVVKNVIQMTKEKFDYIVLLQPTSPLRNEKHIDEAIELLKEKDSAKAIISVTEVEHSPLWSNTLPKDNSMKNFIKDDIKNLRRQDLKKFYRLNGAIYICDIKKFLEEKTFIIKDSFAYIMNREDSIDIDEELDLLLAQTIMEKNLRSSN